MSSILPEEYHELLTFFANESTSANNVVSLALAQLNETTRTTYNTSTYTSEFENDILGGMITSSSVNISDTSNAMNQSLSNITNSPAHRTPRINIEAPIWLITCYSIIFVCSIVGNVLVMTTLCQNRRMRTITNVFLFNLAASDILLGMFCMPITLIGTVLRQFVFGEFVCKGIQFAQAASVAVSSWTLVAISCERYYAICHPLSSRTWQTISHAYRIIIVIWVGSILSMMPIMIFSKLMPTSRKGYRKCRENWPENSIGYERSYNIGLDIALLVLPLLILCFAYIQITRTLYIGMQNERAMIFGTSNVGRGYNENMEVVEEIETLSPTKTAPSNRFQWNMSFRTRGRGCSTARSEIIYEQEQQNQSQQHHKKKKHCPQQQQERQQSYDDIGEHKRKLLTAPANGRRHMYYMRTASMKSLNQNNNDRSGGTGGGSVCITTPSPSMTVINVPQQQRFNLQQQRQHQHQNVEGRKSNSTPSLRITDGALRRSNKTKSLESKKRVIKMLFVLVLEFFICWTPLYVINTLAMFIGPPFYKYINHTCISVVQLLAYTSSCCNPITYCFMNAGFRRAFLDSFKGLQFCGRLLLRKNSKNLSTAGNSIIMANSTTMMTTNSLLDSPRL